MIRLSARAREALRRNGRSALTNAINYGSIEVSRVLMKDGRLKLERDDKFFLVMRSEDKPDIVEFFLDNTDDLNNGQLTDILGKSVYGGHINLINRMLSDSRIDPNDVMIIPVLTGNNEIFDILIRHPRVNPAYWHSAALRHAILKGNLYATDRLLDDPRVKSDTGDAIVVASRLGYLDIVNKLLDLSNTDPSMYGNTAVKSAFQNKKYEVVARLLLDPRLKVDDDVKEIIRSLSLQ